MHFARHAAQCTHTRAHRARVTELFNTFFFRYSICLALPLSVVPCFVFQNAFRSGCTATACDSVWHVKICFRALFFFIIFLHIPPFHPFLSAFCVRDVRWLSQLWRLYFAGLSQSHRQEAHKYISTLPQHHHGTICVASLHRRYCGRKLCSGSSSSIVSDGDDGNVRISRAKRTIVAGSRRKRDETPAVVVVVSKYPTRMGAAMLSYVSKCVGFIYTNLMLYERKH